MSSEIVNEDIVREQTDLKGLLDKTVFNIIREEMRGRGGLYARRGGPIIAGYEGKITGMYDFVRVEEDSGDSRLIMVLFNDDNANWWDPEGLYENQTMFPIGTDRGIVYDKFRTELEAGTVPDVVFVQTGERTKQEDDRRWDCFQTVCFEVKNQEQVVEVEKLVQGLRTKEILDRKPEEVEKILERVENDPELVSEVDFKFDYIGIRNYIGGSGEDHRKFVREQYWGGEDNNES